MWNQVQYFKSFHVLFLVSNAQAFILTVGDWGNLVFVAFFLPTWHPNKLTLPRADSILSIGFIVGCFARKKSFLLCKEKKLVWNIHIIDILYGGERTGIELFTPPGSLVCFCLQKKHTLTHIYQGLLSVSRNYIGNKRIDGSKPHQNTTYTHTNIHFETERK